MKMNYYLIIAALAQKVSPINNDLILNRWQARIEGDKNIRAGLIPSRTLQERRIIHERSLMGKDPNKGKLETIGLMDLLSPANLDLLACFLLKCFRVEDINRSAGNTIHVLSVSLLIILNDEELLELNSLSKWASSKIK